MPSEFDKEEEPVVRELPQKYDVGNQMEFTLQELELIHCTVLDLNWNCVGLNAERTLRILEIRFQCWE